MSKNFSKMMESANRAEALGYIVLQESNIEKAEIVLAVKGEIVDKLQRQAEVINNMGVDVLGPLLDRIKAEHGLDAAESFRNNISGLLEHAVKTLMDVKDKISTETLKLTGDITSTPSIGELDDGLGSVDASVDVETPEFDFEADADLADVVDGEPTPIERQMKESVQAKRIGVEVESTSGKRGRKFFESKAQMKAWLTENQNKIKRVIGPAK